MSEFTVRLKTECNICGGTGRYQITPTNSDWCSCDNGYQYREVELSVALRAVLKANPSLLREVRRDAVKPSEIL